MVVKEEQGKNVKCSGELENVRKELVFSDNDSNNVKQDEIIRGLEDMSDELGEDSNSTKIEDSAGSDGEIREDDIVIRQEKISESEGEVDKEEPCDVEDGEISENVEKKPVCRFFLRGNCYFGSQCQFLHVSDKVYKMFDFQALSKRSKNTIVPSFPPEISQPLFEASSCWENGLKTAKAMIQDSIKKREEDKEFENKKLYISPEVCRSNIGYSKEKELESKCRTSGEKSFRPELVKHLKDTGDRKFEKQPSLRKDNSKPEYKWVDPWMRSNKDSKTHTTMRKHKRHRSSISSASSLENIDINPKQSPKERLTRKSSSRNSCRKSYSRSRSRSSSRNRVSYSTHSHSRRNSPSYRKHKQQKMRRSSSLEKWFKKEVSNVRHSRSPSCSSLDSLKSYESSMTVSSLSCSQTSSFSSSNESKSSLTERDKKSPDSKVSGSVPQHQRRATSSFEQANIRSGKPKDLKQKVVSPKHTEDTIPQVKPLNKPVNKPIPKKKNPALRELLRYANIKPKATSSVVNSTSVQQASKPPDLDSSTSDSKAFISTNPRRNITLNLQTPKSIKQKISGAKTKLSGVSELPNTEVISKKDSLLKQLKLVEQAIARKKSAF